MAEDGLVNVGQLVRERYGQENVFALGFGSYQGSVIASEGWGAPMEAMRVPPARRNSWEYLLHAARPGEDSLLISRDISDKPDFKNPLAHRAIGVVYHPEREARGNYVPSVIPERYDAFLQVDHSHALHALHMEAALDKTPEAYPWGV